MRVFGCPPAKRAELQGFLRALDPHEGDTVNKAELTAALAMRTKMSKADAGRAIEQGFDRPAGIEIGRAHV